MPADTSPVSTTLSPSEVKERMQEIQEAIWQRRPILGDIMKRHGNDRLYDYARDFMDVNPAPRLDGRKAELIAVAQDLIAKRLSPTVAEEVARQLERFPLVSTADHHSPIQHPFWVNANIISSLPYLATNNPLLKYLVVFSFASVSLNNASGYPRGIMVHSGPHGTGQMLKFPLMPDREKMATVYGTRSFTRAELDKTKADILKKEREGMLAAGRGTALVNLVEKYFGAPSVLNASDVATQITHLNFLLWQEIFHPGKQEVTIAPHPVPDLIYLEIETLVTELLVRHHLNNPGSLIYKALFDPVYRPLVAEHFNNIPGAFSLEKNWGTHFFWGIDDKRHRVRMFLNGELHSEMRRHMYPWTPEGLSAALKTKELMPSMALCYLVVSLYYGMKCLGGFSQVNDLTMTKAAWQKILRAAGEAEEADAVEPVQTRELGGDGMVLAYLEDAEHHITPGSSFDLILDGESTTYDKYLELSKRVTLSDMMSPMLPEMYTVLYAQYERDERLLAVTPEAIIETINVHDKIFEK